MAQFIPKAAKLAANYGRIIQRQYTNSTSRGSIGYLGTPFAKGQPHPGVALGPEALRKGGLLKSLTNMGYDVVDHGDMKFEEVPDDTVANNIKNPQAVGNAMQQISNKVSEIRRAGQKCLSIGGDSSIPIGTIHGNAQVTKDMTSIFVGSHPDLNPPSTSESGNAHGMVFSFLLRELAGEVPNHPAYSWIKPVLSAKDVAFIALREVDPPERHLISRYGLTCYSMQDIDRHGIGYVLEHALEKINPGLKRPIHLSVDIGSLDPQYAPSTGTQVNGGLTLREGMYITEQVGLTGQLTAMDLVEVNPTLGTQAEQEKTVRNANELVEACFGKRGMQFTTTH